MHPAFVRHLLTVCLGLCLGVAGARAATLVSTNTVWKFAKGIADPSPDSIGGWRIADFSDATWAAGPAPFQQDSNEALGTMLPDMRDHYSTLFLRRTFLVSDPDQLESLELQVACDDGFVAWINGQRVVSKNAPVGEPAWNAVATAAVVEPVGFRKFALPNALPILVPGENVLAIQVLNVGVGDADVYWDASLDASFKAGSPPVVASVDPMPGLITNLTSITVTFSKPVTGVEASQFLVNDQGATSISGGDTTYTFSFNQPAPGLALITWGALHKIRDTETPPVRFPQGGPGSSWTYQVLDPNGPRIQRLVPPASTALKSFSELELNFNRPVVGVDARDLRANGIPAESVTGIGAGPYFFRFNTILSGTAQLTWTPGHGIESDEPVPHPFAAEGWAYRVNPAMASPAIRINEFLAENLADIKDEDQDPEDWIELYNAGADEVNLLGWTISNDRDTPDQWTFPEVRLPAGGYLLVWASGKDRTVVGKPLHTNFKLNPTGDTLRLFGPGLPREVVDEVRYPEQGPNYSYARVDGDGAWRHFAVTTPRAANGVSPVVGKVGEVHFSVERGFFAAPFNLTLAVETPGAVIRYTTNGSPPLGTNGFLYNGPIPISASKIIRAAASAENYLPSRVQTHTYLYGLPANRKLIPAMSLVTATNNLYGRTGIMEYSPRNTNKHGPAWERPVSMEWIEPDGSEDFQVDCGIRVQGGGYIRELYNYRSSSIPESKYSFRLYFRGEYGQGRLKRRLFPNTTLDEFDTIVLRAGMNDAVNPFIKDEFNRTLASDIGQPASHGAFVNLFINGEYKGYYNPAERIDIDFLQAYHGGGRDWDVVASFSEKREGDLTAWNKLLSTAASKPSTNQLNYLDLARQLDLTNFVDYLLMPIYVDADDWPHNNWRAARERTPQGRFRFYAWDVEWSFGDEDGHDVTWDTIRGQISNTSPPWGGIEIQRLFNNLKRSPEFRLLFADRVHRAFFNGGPLTDEHIRMRWNETRARMNGTIPSIANRVATTWIPKRRANVIRHLNTAGFLASSNAPVLNRWGGTVPAGFSLVLTNLNGSIHFTTDGSDPRTAFSGAVSPTAQTYTDPLRVDVPVSIKARSLSGTNWSAIVEATFQVSRLESALRVSEIMYKPPGGDVYEYLELLNTGAGELDLSGYSFEGIQFRFNNPGPKLGPGKRLVLANENQPSAWMARYPGVSVAGWFGGSLNNGGETLRVLDSNGNMVLTVRFSRGQGWQGVADGGGASLEWTGSNLDPDDPLAWQPSSAVGGTPGVAPAFSSTFGVRLSEIAAVIESGEDWIELRNPTAAPVALTGWQLTDLDQTRRFQFPAGTSIPAQGYLKVWCSTAMELPGLNTGFSLDGRGDVLQLMDAKGRRVDGVMFGAQVAGLTVGRLGDSTDWKMCVPTPGVANEAGVQGSAADVRLNEFLANADGADDWVELVNRGEKPIDVNGFHLATINAVHRIACPAFVPPGGHVIFKADGNAGPEHIDFKLPSERGSLKLFSPDGELLDSVDYGLQLSQVTLGRLPDATGDWVALPFSASPAEANYLAALGTTLRLAEFMASATGVFTNIAGWGGDWLELENVGKADLDLGGYSVSVGRVEPGEWRLPQGVRLNVGARLLLWCSEAHPASTNASPVLNLGRGLPREGSVVTLFDGAGRVLDQVAYGAQVPDQSVGRVNGTWTLLSQPTPGTANAPAAEIDSPALVRFNEWLAEGGFLDDFVELVNTGTRPVNLDGCFLTDNPSIAGYRQFTIGPLTFVAAQGVVRFIADENTDAGPDHLNFKLHPLGESLRLLSPSQGILDAMDYGIQWPGVSEGRYPDGSPNVVRFVGSVSPGAANWLVASDTDGDGIPDGWEVEHGMNPTSAADALLDPDGDGVGNRDEYQCGTDPRDPTSRLVLEFGVTPEGGHQLEFEAALGRAYTVLVRQSTALDGAWLKWMDVQAGGHRRVALPLPVADNARATLYFRIVTPMMP